MRSSTKILPGRPLPNVVESAKSAYNLAHTTFVRQMFITNKQPVLAVNLIWFLDDMPQSCLSQGRSQDRKHMRRPASA